MKFTRILPLILCVLLSACSAQNADQAAESASAEQIVKSDKHPDSRETTLGPIHTVVSLSNSKPTLASLLNVTLFSFPSTNIGW